MHRWERFALVLVLLVAGGLPVALALPASFPPSRVGGRRVVEVVARAPEAGGWSPREIVIHAGEPVRLRLHAEDVVHGLRIAHLGLGLESILPGEVYELDLEVAEPGRYALYCDVWCSPQHYRMRGTLVVLGPDGGAEELPVPAIDSSVDPDAPHEARLYPLETPSPARGARIAAQMGISPEDVLEEGRPFAAASPEDLYLRVRGTGDLSEGQAWDVLAFLWRQRLDENEWAAGRNLYARNCAACHGPAGGGDGPAAGEQPQPPAAFTNARSMGGADEAILRAKIVRGGMGTGMPYWGRIFTEKEIESLLSYLWGFLLNPEATP